MTLRAVRGSFSASFDGMILTHFYVARIRDFRHDGDDCAFLIGSNLLHRSADSSTCCCQVHTQVFQSLPKRKLNLFSMFFFVAHTFPFFSVRSFCARFFLSNGTKKAPRAVRGSLSVSFDGMILSHFCKVCIRVFRHDSVDVLLSCETHYYLTFPLYLQPHQRLSPASATSRTPSCRCTLRKQSSRS